ncbi:DUF6705 family protein [Nonlabens spongiae]|nr:DUF6705 family protein [Nonlabens spongiae]
MSKFLILKLLFLLTLMSSFTLHSQVILPLDSIGFMPSPTPVKYYSDVNNEMDFFVGTWLYTEGSTTLKIHFKKETRVDWGDHFTDLLVGEYQYIENGVEMINTLDMIDSRNGYEHIIDGRIRVTKCSWLPTSECRDGQVKFFLGLSDPNNEMTTATLIIHESYRDINDRRDAIRAYIIFTSHQTLDPGETYDPPTMPWQKEYRMVRQ